MLKPKQIYGLIELVNDGWGVAEGIATATPGSIARLNIGAMIAQHFPPLQYEVTPDRGITFEIDLFLFCNHLYNNDGEQVVHHYSLTANRLFRFSVLKPHAADVGSNHWIYNNSDIVTLAATGMWVEYDSSAKIHGSIVQVGKLGTAAITVSLASSTSNLYFDIDVGNLQDQINWEADPNYEVSIKYKVRLFEYSIEDYTREDV